MKMKNAFKLIIRQYLDSTCIDETKHNIIELHEKRERKKCRREMYQRSFRQHLADKKREKEEDQ